MDTIHPTVVAVGHVCSDTICVLDGFPPENTSKHIESVDMQSGGGASQAIVAFSRLGGTGGYVGNIGTDETGSYLTSELEHEGVDITYVRTCEGMSSFSFVCVNSQNASRTLINYHDKLPPIQFTPEIERYIASANYVHLDGTMYENAIQAAVIAKKHGVLVSLDGSSVQKDNVLNRELAKLADILIMSEIYPCWIMEDDDRERALLNIATWGAMIVISTLGEKGCMAVVDGAIRYFPTFSDIVPIDTTGAGDVYHGAFLRGLELGYSLEKTIKFASAVSSMNCLTLGGRRGIPNFDETIAFMQAHPYR
ncbi:Sulfofructose kinase [bioreactor metagenome]|uniref:Sulfofructose kinase n=1 Tax=bioreactor metagenome TaxID=1076179 RepID=A0A644ZFU3_9ZZZZ